MKRFLNERDDLVDQAIDGLLASSAGVGLARLADGAGHRVVLRTDFDRSHVALVSGGGSGHEPAHAGFVGPGMLTAAVCGEIFSSPPVDAVLAAILAVTGEAGCLLIIKNYTGDRLNFGLAAERARLLGLRVETVTVADDIALPDQAQPRGIAGTLFVHRIAGHMAEAGRPLEEIARAARAIASDAASIGLSLSACDPYAGGESSRLAADQIELGLGIHGEPGAQLLPMAPADALVAKAVERLEHALTERAVDAPLALIVNNLGTVPPIEMSLLLDAVRRSPLGSRAELVIGPAPLMTALDMNGFSLSVLPLDETRRAALTAPSAIAAWPVARPLQAPRTVPAPVFKDEEVAASEAPETRALLLAASTLLQGMERDINAIDARIGDGDTGTTFAQTARAIAASIDTLPLADEAALMGALGRLCTREAGGSSGVLLSILFSAAATARADGAPTAEALQAGLLRMKAHGGADLGDRTMIDALEPGLDALAAGGGLAQAAEAARTGADSTRLMDKARAGRAGYVPAASLRDVPDPGAELVARLLEGLARG